MDKDIAAYIKHYPSLVDLDLCNSTIDQLNNVEFIDHTFLRNGSDYVMHDNEIKVFRNSIPNDSLLINVIKLAVKTYHSDINLPWWGWKTFTKPKYNRYDPNTEMTVHCDHIHDIFDGTHRGIPILTVLVLLNDNFQGGDLILCNDIKYNLQAGDVLVFPSNFLYPHEVKMVTDGIRFSFVSWVF